MGILRIRDLNKGMALKQGDKTTLKFELYDANDDPLVLSSAGKVYFKQKGQVYAEEDVTITTENVVSFKLNTILPAGKYYIEFVVDDKVFPSQDIDTFHITSSVLGDDITVIAINGIDRVAGRALALIEDDLQAIEEEELTRIQAELDRQAQEEARETAEAQREANEGDRVQAEIEREIIFEAQKKPLIMGVEWGRTADPTMTRIGASKDLVANIGIGDEIVRNDFDTMPIYREMQRETDKFGNVFVRIPKFYIRKTVTDELYRVEISTEKLKGFYLPAIFYDFEKDKELEYSLFGAYIASDSADGTKLESKPGVEPLVNQNIVQFRDYAMSNGEGYQQLDIHAIDVLQTLFRVEFATLDSQSLHPGFTDTGNDESAFTGGTDGLTATSGAMGTSGSHQFVYRGIEDPWGNVYQFVDGVSINDHQAWVCRDARQYASNVFASPYEKLGYVNATENIWVTEMGYDPNHPFAELPVTSGGSATTYYADQYYQNTGQRITRFGGSWSADSGAGLSLWSSDYSSASVRSVIGGRLMKKTL